MTEKNATRTPPQVPTRPAPEAIPPIRPSIPAGVTRADRRRVAELAQHMLRD